MATDYNSNDLRDGDPPVENAPEAAQRSSNRGPTRESSDNGCSARWSRLIKQRVHKPIMKMIQAITLLSARNPKRMISGVVALSVILLVAGLATNFTMDVDEVELWTPKGSAADKHMHWIDDESGFPEAPHYLLLFFHGDGDNVLGQNQVSKIFDAVDQVRMMDGYDNICKDTDYTNSEGKTTCEILGVPRFWNSSTSAFEENAHTDEQTIAFLSTRVYADGTPVAHHSIYGNPEYEDEGETMLTSVQAYTVVILLPDTDKADEWALDAVDLLLDLDDRWAADPGTSFRVETEAYLSFGEEFERGIFKDMPLIPLVFVIMSIFTAIVFSRKNKVYSRSLLGFGAVVTVLLSLMSGFGFLFLCGVPFTSMTQILPFIIFGIGLDDAFIVMGALGRTDHFKSPEERVIDSFKDIGMSITLTTITSSTAFGLGCLSKIPVVFWLCLYAFPSIIIVYLYQLSFFTACIVLDERRISDRRRDCCVWVSAKNYREPEGSGTMEGPERHLVDRFMEWYGKKLLIPWVKALVAIAFSVLLGTAAWSASMFHQYFKFTSVLPGDSYIADVVDATDAYTERTHFIVGVYFRYVDQSNETIQSQMKDFMEDIVGMESVIFPPDHFWLEDFELFAANQTGTFGEKVDKFLSVPSFYNLYHEDIVQDSETRNVVESRAFVRMDNVAWDDIKEQTNAYEAQLEVAKAHPINRGLEGNSLKFFCFGGMDNIWEFYRASVRELTLTTIYGVTAVTGVAFLIIPHRSAALFVFPFISILYVDLLGVMQWAGLHVNAVSYIGLVMSIGLLVDYLVHVLLRYYECKGDRRKKTIEMLRTMGSSILLGGISTFLGILPLALSTSEIFHTIFITFLGIVTLGLGHGLVLLPVVLSTFGPEDQVSMASHGDK